MSEHSPLLQAILRQDLATFMARCFAELEPGTPYLENWHVHAIAHQLTRVYRGELKRLIVNVPPRSGKSILITVGFMAWLLGHQPHKRMMAVSYAKELSRKHASDFHKIVTSAWFAELFPACQIATDRSDEMITTEHGYRYAGSVGGSILGRGANLIVIDDPIKGLDAALSEAARRRVNEFYDNTLYSRLNNKREDAIVIVMQRLHVDDLVGHVLGKEDWEVLSIPAIAPEDATYRIGPRPGQVFRRRAGDVLHPEREPREVLEAIRRILGSFHFSAQYQQNPIPLGGNVVKRDWLRRYGEPPDEFEIKIASWDTASTIGETSDWSVGTVWGAIGQDFYLLDLVRGRWEVPELRRRVVEVARRHRADANLIEDTELGRALTQDLRRTGELLPILQRSRFSKVSRMSTQAARFEAGQVYLPKEAPWLDLYLSELLAFPAAKNDDQVDSTSQALKYLTARTPVVRARPQRVIRPQQRVRRAA